MLNSYIQSFRKPSLPSNSNSQTRTLNDSKNGSPPSRRGIARLKAEVAAALALLEEGQGWVLRSALRTRALIAQVRPHVVVSSGPPHLPHLSAWLATRGRRIPWLVDLRDPWAGPVSESFKSHLYVSTMIGRGTVTRLERMVFRAASGITVNTREIAEAISERCGEVPVHWLSNGTDTDLLPTKSPRPFPGLAITYLGGLYGARNLDLVLRAFNAVLDHHPTAAAVGSKIRVAGHGSGEFANALRLEITRLGLDRHVDLMGFIPRPEALDVLARSNLAVVLAQDQEHQIPGKLYESVAMGIPTVVIAERESASAREAMRLGASVVEPDNLTEMIQVLEETLAADQSLPHTPPPEIHYRQLAVRLDEILEQLLNSEKPQQAHHA